MTRTHRLKNQVLLAALATAFPAMTYAAAARIEFSVGKVLAINAAGTQRELVRGSVLELGETINTGDGRAQLRFSDGALMSLQPQTEFRIDDYRYSGTPDGQEKGFFSLLRGGLRTITGLIGKGNRDNYRVTTSVATIGIRGTEYAATFSGGSEGELNLSTGEGAIEVCNAGGCVLVAGGESAIVTGEAQPRRTDVRPSLPAAAATNPPPTQTLYSQIEDRTASGDLSVLQTTQVDFSSGSGYALATRYVISDESYAAFGELSTATFGTGNQLLAASSSYFTETFANGVVTDVGVIREDGKSMLGWGRWTSGTVDNYGSPNNLAALHYVIGMPSSNLSNLSGQTGTYTLVGGTTPTSAGNPGAAGATGLVSGALSVNFGGSGIAGTNLSLSVNYDGSNYSISGSGGGSSNATFSGSGGSGTLAYSGILAGANGKYAGITYSINNDISGAAGFLQSGLGGPPP